MNYQQTIDYLYNKLPLFSRLGASAIKPDITNTIRICEHLGNPQLSFPSIHIAGTNGKGSVSHMLAAILQTAGYKTGLYTSPHLSDFRERIKINGKWCDEHFVIDFTERVTPLIEDIQPSFFEITVAMAFTYFAKEKVDIAIIETGLGGRLDSTNIITPLLSIITNIGWDHSQILGDTLSKIAFEKAGIIKQNVPVIIGEIIPETEAVFREVAGAKNAPLILAQHNYFVADFESDHQQLTVTVAKTANDERETYQTDLAGIYQTRNLLSVLEAVHYLQTIHFQITLPAVQEALQHVKKLTGLHGRWELVKQKPNLILDVAHNAEGMKQVAEQLELATYHQLHIVIGMVKDKDVSGALQHLPTTAQYYFTKPQTPRALPEHELAKIGHQHHLKGNSFADLDSALQTVLTHAHADDLILVCGSVFLVGEYKP